MTDRTDDDVADSVPPVPPVGPLDVPPPSPPPVAAAQVDETIPASEREREIMALNELRVQMLEMLGTQRTNDDGRYCWVCFATDEDDKLAAWVQPCKCSGTTKWVHQSCLQRWVDEKQKGNAFKRVNCPQCRTEYIIVFPEMGTFVSILEGIDSIIKRLSPFLAAGVIVGSLYWTAVTYGAVTVLTLIL